MLLSPAVAASVSSSAPQLSAAARRRHRRHALSKRGALSPDRFIPSSSSFSLFHVDSPPNPVSPSSRRQPPPRPTSHSASASPAARAGATDTNQIIANALGIGAHERSYTATGLPSPQTTGPARVLQFQQRHYFAHDRDEEEQRNAAIARFAHEGHDRVVGLGELSLVMEAASARPARESRGNGNGARTAYPKKKTLKRVLSYAPFRVLDAPGLRDDFYTNLLSWSSTTDDLVVGLNHEVYIWTEASGAVLLPEWGTSPVACVSFAPDGTTLAIGRMDGVISCWGKTRTSVREEYFHTIGFCCITWRPMPEGSKVMEFYAGDEAGAILRFKVYKDEIDRVSAPTQIAMEMTGMTKGHSQQICGIEFNSDGTQMAVGANDNTCTIWDVGENGPAEYPRYRWDHRAAVKALAYCPWSSSLLATGGGSNDRTIRFWHTNSGSLINSFNTNAQVTSLVWSRTSREIAATFGYANPEHPIRMAIYSYPDCRPIIQIPWQEDIRCLYAVLSPGGGKVCTAASDETVRFYDFWDEKCETRVSTWDDGIFGSDILELCEGIEKKPSEVIR
ncbi:WD40-repeat-containing domain protein [Myxozyma melibiosi]|uniref:WD40-repeat-containing domain protein n=1 Tax=Myxozyma melibiosi TaxID=54550 RepID=A0ABR1F5H9_9ASCO